ncbi:MAG: MacB family efflux pump subunit [Parvibaculum sp.]|uniref:MacB family efflux pump subunit n=1 Tax=Parvibaculum sp. TaxID=2024848 RepID=UPI00271EB79E|nr:MacB family efflux pump subunit [Parvibaculum sp.]MDO8838352.1 MacB family efflux pump subunit [Parvibaculum sp.]
MTAPTHPPLVALRDVTRVYRTGDTEVRALDGVSLTIRAGEFVAIMGQSGSGKSTLMNIIGCLDRPSAGHYLVNGADVATLSGDELAALRRDTFGFVFQRYNLLATMTATENVELPAVYAGKSRQVRAAGAQRLISRLGLADRGNHRPNELSGGQQQRVSIARALMNDAQVILADEPTGALDSQSGAEVLALLAELNADGHTVILITHDPTVAAHANRLIRLADGKVVEDSVTTPDETRRGGADRGAPARPLIFGADVGEAVKMAFRSLRMNLFRTALTLLGVVIGVGAVVVMLAIGDGSKANVMSQIQAMGTNLLIVRAGGPGVRTAEVTTLNIEDVHAILELPNVVTAVPERSTGVTMRFGNRDHRTQIQGTWPQFPLVNDWDVAEGGFFNQADVNGYAPVIVLGQTVAETMFPDGESAVGQYVLVQSVPFEVVGTMQAKGAAMFGRDQDDVALVPMTTGTMRLFGRHHLSSISVKVTDAAYIDETQAAIEALLMARHGTEDFRVRNTASLLEMADATYTTLTILLGSVAAISLLVGGIGVMNIMLVSVTERTREIGIRMATGARKRDILLQFNTEALVVCGIGGASGILLGLGLAGIAQWAGMNVAFSAGPPILAFSCAFLTGLLFGYLPARKAANLDPVAALATE